MTDKKTLWSEAGRAGLVLGAVSSAYLLITWGTGKIPAESTAVSISVKLLNFVLWAAKFAGCILLMKFFMKGFAAQNEENPRSFAFGVAVAFLSAVVYSAVNLAFYTFIQPSYFSDAIEMLRDNPMFNEAMMEEMENMTPMFPAVNFVVNLVYCTLFGTVVSAILSRNIPARNPFQQQQ